MVETIDIDYTKHADSVLFCEEVFIQYDCIYNDAGNKVPAFQITENMAEGNKYRVNARRQQYTADHRLIYIFPQITTFDSIEECKEFIFEYINDSVSQAIFNDQHRNALEALKWDYFSLLLLSSLEQTLGSTLSTKFQRFKMPNSKDSAKSSRTEQDTTKPAKNIDKLSPYLQDVINNEKVVRTPRGPLSDWITGTLAPFTGAFLCV